MSEKKKVPTEEQELILGVIREARRIGATVVGAIAVDDEHPVTELEKANPTLVEVSTDDGATWKTLRHVHGTSESRVQRCVAYELRVNGYAVLIRWQGTVYSGRFRCPEHGAPVPTYRDASQAFPACATPIGNGLKLCSGPLVAEVDRQSAMLAVSTLTRGMR